MWLVILILALGVLQPGSAEAQKKEILSFGLRFYVEPNVIAFVQSNIPSVIQTDEHARRFITGYYISLLQSVNRLYQNILKNYEFHFTVEGFRFLERDLNSIAWNVPNGPEQTNHDFRSYLATKVMKQQSYNESNIIHALLVKRAYTSHGVMGLAELNGVCKSYHKQSLTMVANNGDLTKDTLSHEISHLLGGDHDSNECVTNKTKLMMTHINSGHKDRFSNCTRLNFAKVILNNCYPCAKRTLSKMSKRDVKLSRYYLGSILELHEQCSERLNSANMVSKERTNNGQKQTDMSKCNIICYFESNEAAYIHLRAMDGTKCDKNKMCLDSNCVDVPRKYKKIFENSAKRNLKRFLSLVNS